MKTLNDYNFSGKKAIIRVDFNVPLNDKFEITDETRIKAVIPTVEKILKDGGSVILMSHLGRPKDGPEEKSSLKHIVARAEQEEQKNITAILSPENSVSLPPNSVDVAFICDTYHHFEFPRGTMKSLIRSLKRGGTVVVIDFERIEGVTRDWLFGHVRAGKQVFRKEIEDAGLTFVEELKIDGFKENYFLRFRKD